MLAFALPTRYADYDTKGHVNNAVYLTYFEVARQRAWGERMGRPPDYPFVVAEAQVRYASPAMLGEPLVCEVETAEVRTKAWVWSYRVRTADGRLVAEGRTTQVMYDYAVGRSVEIPADVRAGLEAV